MQCLRGCCGPLPALPLWVRRLLMALNLLSVLWIVVSSTEEGDDVGLEVATDWIVIAGTLGQAMLLYRLLARPRRTAARLHLQSLGTLAACNALRALGVSHWSIRRAVSCHWPRCWPRSRWPASAPRCGTGAGAPPWAWRAKTVWRSARSRCAPHPARLVARLWPARPGAPLPPLRKLLEHAVLPAAALAAGTLLEAAPAVATRPES
ncbi:unnamed protein product [Prorocentrum cordatum]|uniref:Transmembrane protein 138 n=1 Tax=Prorocentrum cordatum TaxID=2364126 RepID=A0ABN9RN52_9DINO|nr:unnamed protein product [Polarella glacialis]